MRLTEKSIKLTGKELVSLNAEEENKPIWTITQLTLNSLLNSYILGNIESQLKHYGKIYKSSISFFSINDIAITKRTRIHTIFNVSLKEYPKDGDQHIDHQCMYTYLDVSDFYNAIVDLFFDYAKIFNTSVSNIKLQLIAIEIMPPVTFTNSGFINSKTLNCYDLDGQIDILRYLLKTQKWEFTNNKLIFTELINDKFVEALIKQFNMEIFIDCQSQKKMAVLDSEALGIKKTVENINKEIAKQECDKLELDKIIDINRELYSLNLTEYKPKFDKGEFKDAN